MCLTSAYFPYLNGIKPEKNSKHTLNDEIKVKARITKTKIKTYIF